MNTISSFSQLDIIDPIRRALHSEGYTVPTPIQAQAIPLLLAGRDLLGCAQTGTGKTAAFAIPILTRLAGSPRREGLRGPRALVLAPTRELASQIGESFASYGRHLPLRHVVVFGGVGQKPQVDGIRRGAEILVATPGRLLDLMQQGHVRLDGVEALVLDEGDRMLDMGFIQPIRRIVAAVPRQRQTMLFSATLPPDIVALASGMLHNPATVSVTPTASTAEKVSQWVLHVQSNNKRNLLAEVLRDRAMARVLVFTHTKHGANRVAEHLNRGGVCSEAIHGNKSQSARERALAGFKKGSVRVLVATDIASRGIDVDGITHVINFEIPNEPESYVHRIGRTGRAGAAGIALSFCDPSERTFLRDIERLTRARLRVVERHPYSGPQRSPGAIALV
ncbi:MAG: DEAD/DEAH box helicase [Polyangia bacterium]